MVSWSAFAPSTSIFPRILSQAFCAFFLTLSKEVFSGSSMARFFFAWSTLISDVARRRPTLRSLPASKRKNPVTSSPPPPFSLPLSVTGASEVPYTKRRVAPVDPPLFTSEYPVKLPVFASRVSPPSLVTLSKTRLASSPG